MSNIDADIIEFHNSQGNYEDSWKAPDISVHSLAGTLPNLVIEVAFPETREHARRKAAFWLNASNALPFVILIHINEMEARHRALADGSEVGVPNTQEEEPEDDL